MSDILPFLLSPVKCTWNIQYNPFFVMSPHCHICKNTTFSFFLKKIQNNHLFIKDKSVLTRSRVTIEKRSRVEANELLEGIFLDITRNPTRFFDILQKINFKLSAISNFNLQFLCSIIYQKQIRKTKWFLKLINNIRISSRNYLYCWGLENLGWALYSTCLKIYSKSSLNAFFPLNSALSSCSCCFLKIGISAAEFFPNSLRTTLTNKSNKLGNEKSLSNKVLFL